MFFQISMGSAKNAIANGVSSGGGTIDLNSFLNGTASAGPANNVNLGANLPAPRSTPVQGGAGGGIDLNKFLNGTATAGQAQNINPNHSPSTGHSPSTPSLGLGSVPASVILKGMEQIDQAMKDLNPDTLKAISGTVGMIRKIYDASPQNLQKSPKGVAISEFLSSVDDLGKHYADRPNSNVTLNPKTWGNIPARLNNNLDINDGWVGVLVTADRLKTAFK